MLAYLLLLPLAIALPLYSRQNTTGGNVTSPSTGSGTGSASTPSVTLYPHGSGNEPVKVSGLAFPQFGQDVYLGLPFAQPRESTLMTPNSSTPLTREIAVGDLRFTPPQPAVYNGSAVTATTQPPACLQNPNGSLVGSFGISEDCLYLNVFTPQGAGAKTAYLPVMVWV